MFPKNSCVEPAKQSHSVKRCDFRERLTYKVPFYKQICVLTMNLLRDFPCLSPHGTKQQISISDTEKIPHQTASLPVLPS